MAIDKTLAASRDLMVTFPLLKFSRQKKPENNKNDHEKYYIFTLCYIEYKVNVTLSENTIDLFPSITSYKCHLTALL